MYILYRTAVLELAEMTQKLEQLRDRCQKNRCDHGVEGTHKISIPSISQFHPILVAEKILLLNFPNLQALEKVRVTLLLLHPSFAPQTRLTLV